MNYEAAVLVETGRPLEIVDIESPPLRSGQVLVDIAFSGVCHTQLLEVRGHRGQDRFLPHCLGHEGSGVVAETGADVTKVSPGDPVVISWMKGSGLEVPGLQYDWAGKKVNSGAVTTFSRFAVVSENRLTPIGADISLDDAALLGCAVPTGVGVVLNTLSARPGQSIAVFGAGGVGLCAIAGAAISGCSKIIAVDIVAPKLKTARVMGATDVIDSSSEDVLEALERACPAGFDLAVEVTGRPAVFNVALTTVRPRGGTVAVVGNPHFGERFDIDPAQINQGKRILGSWGGDNEPDRDFAKYVDFLRTGQLNLNPIKSETYYPLGSINDALDDLEAGRVLRPIVDMAIG